MLSFCDNKTSPHPEDDDNGFLSMEFKRFYIQDTQGEVNHEDGPVHEPSALNDLLGVSSTSMDVDPSSVQRGNRTKCLYASAAVVQRHRPSREVEAAPAGVPTLGPYGQSVSDCACQLCVS